MINTRGLFHIDHEKVDRAVRLIRDARHRFPSDLESEQRDALLAGLAAVACTTRSGDLASDVRLMMRRVRVDRENPQAPGRELLLAATAAGAYGDLAEWTAFLGDWATELAFAVDRHDQAVALYSELDALCIIEPTLRRTAGRALAALQAYVSV